MEIIFNAVIGKYKRFIWRVLVLIWYNLLIPFCHNFWLRFQKFRQNYLCIIIHSPTLKGMAIESIHKEYHCKKRYYYAKASASSLGLSENGACIGGEFSIDIIFHKGVYVCN